MNEEYKERAKKFAGQLEKLFNDANINIRRLIDEDLSYYIQRECNMNDEEAQSFHETLGSFEEVEHWRDPYGEDPKDEYYIFHFETPDVYLKFVGRYSSWDTYPFSKTFIPVEPIEVKVIQYEDIK